ncbi:MULTISPECIES: ImmA/IrrE family metallo-endopeptidase [Burkholderia]|uniref:ImmA/IrrE family metallo-endopeptidase n=1 Tax=Burkholderia TaxID=32008 RepID=UPI0009BDE153|nr:MULTISPECIES: ImmA/IrrE family metallo-endopeptidase [Burkholderia]
MSEPTTPAAWGIQLSKLWTQSGQSFPVNVQVLALEVTKAKFSDPVGVIKPHGVAGIDGMLSKRKSKGDWCISYDEAVTIPGRINFTLGHELGHYFLHRTTRDTFTCGQLETLGYNEGASKKQEAEANKFASFLLMPADDFRQQIAGHPITIDLLSYCASRYDTSFTATALKWLEITDEAAMLVVARDEFVCWSYPSAQASRLGCYMPPGSPVPPLSVERLVEAGAAGDRVVTVPAGVWHTSMEAEESLIVSDQFELAIFLIRFPSPGHIEHTEDTSSDAADFLAERAKGLNWTR